jgi:AcrR family transcriptional regulator
MIVRLYWIVKMPRPKTQTDDALLEAAHQLIRERGPDALTFASMSAICGLSPSTLVQRFKSKSGLMQNALLYAWDQLDARTAQLSEASPRTPAGAIAILVGLSGDYGDIDTYADGLLVLREDLRDPVLRARGAAWKRTLNTALGTCFASEPHAPEAIGALLSAQWQGALLWWGFDPRNRVEDYVAESLERFVAALLGR